MITKTQIPLTASGEMAGNKTGYAVIALFVCWLLAGLTPALAQAEENVFAMPEAPAAFDTLDAREKWFDAQRRAIEKDYNSRLSQILSEYHSCYEGSFHECGRRVVALDKLRDGVLGKLE